MNKIFYTNPVFPNKVALIVTDKPVNQLIEMEILTPTSKYLINPEEGELMTYRISCVKFDDVDNPTALIFDVDAIRQAYIEEVRKIRDDILSTLDYLQLRAIATNNTEAVTNIENDKELVRNLTDTIDYTTITEIRHIYTRIPPELLVDYKEKYSNV
jgi:hypothetical protein